MRRPVHLIGYAGLALLLAAGVVRITFLESGPAALGLAVAGVALFLVYFFRAAGDVQGFLRRRSTREGGSVLGTTLFLLGALVLVNLIGSRARLHADITADRLFTLAPETISALRAAEAPPEFWVFHPDGSPRQTQLRSLLEAARLEEPRTRVHIVDPDRDPARAMEFELNEYATVLRVGERSVTFPGSGEEDIVTALRRATAQGTVRVGFLDGHGESYPEDEGPGGLKEAGLLLHRRGFEARRVNLQQGSPLLHAVDVLVIPGPRVPLVAAETDSVRAFLEAGGRLLVLLDPENPVTLTGLLEPFALAFLPRFVSDPDQQSPQVLVPLEYSGHPVVQTLRDRRVPVVLRGAGEIERGRGGESLRTAGLIWSGPRSTFADGGEDTPRRRLLGAAAERGIEGAPRPARIVVIGDAGFPTNAEFGNLGNGDLFLGAVQWLSGIDELATIRPRERVSRPILVERQQGRALTVLFTLILPAVVLAAGTVVWWRRR